MIIYPIKISAPVIELPNPELGNQEFVQYITTIGKTIDGEEYSYIKNKNRHIKKYTFTWLMIPRETVLILMSYLKTYLHEEFIIINHHNQKISGYLVSDLSFVTNKFSEPCFANPGSPSRAESCTFSLEFHDNGLYTWPEML